MLGLSVVSAYNVVFTHDAFSRRQERASDKRFFMSAFLSDYTDKWECGANLNRFCYSHKFNWLK